MKYTKEDIQTNEDGIKYYKNKLYPIIPFSETDEYIISTVGDRLDILANSYYKNYELWWIIYTANINLSGSSLFIPPGLQIRIPTDINNVIDAYNAINKTR